MKEYRGYKIKADYSEKKPCYIICKDGHMCGFADNLAAAKAIIDRVINMA